MTTNNEVYETLKGPITRVILKSRRFTRAFMRDDQTDFGVLFGDLIEACIELDDAWTSVEAGNLDGLIKDSISATLEQMKRRASHN